MHFWAIDPLHGTVSPPRLIEFAWDAFGSSSGWPDAAKEPAGWWLVALSLTFWWLIWLNYSDLKSRDLTGIMVSKRYPHGGPNNSGWIVIIYPDEWWRMVNKWFRICAYCSWIFSGCGRWETQGSQGQKLTFRGWMVYEIGWIPHDAWFFYGVKHGKTTPF